MLSLKSSLGAVWAAATLPALPLASEASASEVQKEGAQAGGRVEVVSPRNIDDTRAAFNDLTSAVAPVAQSIAARGAFKIQVGEQRAEQQAASGPSNYNSEPSDFRAAYATLAAKARAEGLDVTRPLPEREKRLSDEIISSHLPVLVAGGVISEQESKQLAMVLEGGALTPNELQALITKAVSGWEKYCSETATFFEEQLAARRDALPDMKIVLAVTLLGAALAVAGKVAADKHPKWAIAALGTAAALAATLAVNYSRATTESHAVNEQVAAKHAESVRIGDSSDLALNHALRMHLFRAGQDAYAALLQLQGGNPIADTFGSRGDSK